MKIGPLFVLALVSTSLWGEPAARLTVFLPAGGQASLTGEAGAREVISGVGLACAEGRYTLTATHPDFIPFTREFQIAQHDVIVFPKLELTAAYRNEQAVLLLKHKKEVIREQHAVVTTAALTGVAALAGWASVGGLEYLLAEKKIALAAAQDRYRAASVGDALALWAGVESVKAEIADLRTYENYALATSGVLTMSSLILLFTAPDPREWDGRIREMGGLVE